MRGKGINYDTGFSPGGQSSREHFDADVVRSEMRVIARELHCTAVRVSGAEPARLSTAAELAAAEGLEVWFAPFPCELDTGQLAPLLADCADRAEHLRRTGANVVLVTGCELTLFGAGFLPGGTVYERIQGLQAGGQELYAAFGALPSKLNGFLAAKPAARTSTPASSAAKCASSPGNCTAPPCGSPAVSPHGLASPPSLPRPKDWRCGSRRSHASWTPTSSRRCSPTVRTVPSTCAEPARTWSW